MSLSFYNRQGEAYAYTEDDQTIYTFDGKPVAYIDVEDINAFSGSHLGFFDDGNIWDHNGDVVLYTDLSRFGYVPLKPLKALKPLKRLKSRKPLKGAKVLKPLKPLKSRKWSLSSSRELFS